MTYFSPARPAGCAARSAEAAGPAGMLGAAECGRPPPAASPPQLPPWPGAGPPPQAAEPAPLCARPRGATPQLPRTAPTRGAAASDHSPVLPLSHRPLSSSCGTEGAAGTVLAPVLCHFFHYILLPFSNYLKGKTKISPCPFPRTSLSLLLIISSIPTQNVCQCTADLSPCNPASQTH